MMMQSQALALLETAHNMVIEAKKLIEDDYRWHHPNFQTPPDIAKELELAFRAIYDLKASTHWTVNSLRKFETKDPKFNSNLELCPNCGSKLGVDEGQDGYYPFKCPECHNK
jgi:hypothetical protein